MEAKILIKQCVNYLIESGLERTSHYKEVFLFLNKNFEVVRLEIIKDEVFYNKENKITCLGDLMDIISEKESPEYQKHPKLSAEIGKILNDKKYLEKQENINRFINEINLSLVEARMDAIESTKNKSKKSVC